MPYEHGISILENPTSLSPPVETSAGVQVVFGTAPIHLADDPYNVTNKPVLTSSFAEAKKKLGYHEDFKKYTLCQSMDASYRLFGVSPVIFVNVLDPATHKASVTGTSLSLVNGEAELQEDGVLLDTVVVKSSDGTTTYEKDTDYTIAFNDNNYPLITSVDSGSLAADTDITVDYDKLDPGLVANNDLIGGYDAVNNTYSGIEVISQVYPKLGIVPGILLAPGWTDQPEVAAVLDAKSEKINSNWNALNVLDLDANQNYQDIPSWKDTNGYTSKRSIICYPKVKVGEKTYSYSALVGALLGYVDANNDDVPYKSPSNKELPITACVKEDGTELFLDITQANFLNGNGVFTAINLNGWRSWGNNTAAYPGTTDPKDRFIPIRRVFDWWGNTFIQTYFDKVDDPTNYRLIESIVDSENIRGNGFQAKGHIAGAKIEFRPEDNPTTDILNGKIQFIQKISAFPPARQIENVLEFDPTALNNALFGGE